MKDKYSKTYKKNSYENDEEIILSQQILQSKKSNIIKKCIKIARYGNFLNIQLNQLKPKICKKNTQHINFKTEFF